MILTGPQIAREHAAGRIRIDPFDQEQLNPNSYNYRLGPTLRTHRGQVVDALGAHELDEVRIPEAGIVLEPGRVYLGTTVEAIGSEHFVPSLIGRSSLGRLGVFLQVSADLGNLGAVHRWTLEIVVVQPIRLYPGMVVGQVSFWTPTGARRLYDGHFGRHSEAITPHAALLTAGR
ncbi:2'-deoxycytidine 5'-triphosphate deaminase domain-containing protein [Streptomyces sp. NPDC048496]|uniref:dCTP deaminase n=1 Tax=Streptomyces sp. NPDC048496 TaxID=3365558 RepID=UPI0037177923